MTTAEDIFNEAWAAGGHEHTEEQILAGAYATPADAGRHFAEQPEHLDGTDPEPAALDPAATLPPIIRDFVLDVADHLQVPVEAPAMTALAVLSTAAAGRMWINAGYGWRQPLIIWTATTMRSGERKSDTVRIVAEPIRAAERDAVAIWKDEQEDARQEKAKLTARGKEIREKLKKKANAQLEQDLQIVEAKLEQLQTDQPMPRLLVEDATPEALSQRLEENDERLGVITAEGGLFSLIAGRYSNGTPNLDLYLKSFDEEYLPFDRVTRGTLILQHPALAVGLLVQPHVLDKAVAVPGMRDRGLLGRFLFAVPRSRLGSRDIDAPALLAGPAQEWDKAIRSVLGLPMRPDPRPYLEIDDKAAKLLRELRAQLEPHLDPAAGRFAYMSDWVGKLAGKTLRIAGLYHLAQGYRRERMVGEETMTFAVATGLWALRHAEHVHRGWNSTDTPPGVAPILAWIRRKRPETFTGRDLQALRNASWYSGTARDEALVALHRARWIASVTQYDAAGKRRPTAVFVPHSSLVGGAR